MRTCVRFCVVASALLGLAYAALATTTSPISLARPQDSPVHRILPTDDDAWHDGPFGMPAGTRYAVISGDPAGASHFVIRVELPVGASIAPFRSPTAGDIIILAGVLELGSGGAFDESSMRAFPAGSFVALAAHEPHYARTQQGATVQIVGIGPLTMDYLDAGQARSR